MHQGQPPYNGTNHMDPAMRGPPGQSYQHPPLPPPEPTRGMLYPIDTTNVGVRAAPPPMTKHGYLEPCLRQKYYYEVH